MKRIFLSIIILLAFTTLQYHSLSSKINSIEPVYLNLKEVDIPASASIPSIKLYGKYTGLMDAESNRLLFGKNQMKKAPMASTTKIMTCLIALEQGKRNDIVKVSAKAASMPRVRLGIKSGETYKMNDLLYSLMLVSHNDSAVAIAEHIGGSIEGFADLMNKKAKNLGMTDTNFVTPNGLDAYRHESTAKDMCLLASYAVKNKEFCSIIQTKSHAFRPLSSKRSFTLNNKNAFLSIYDGSIGIKTGFTNKAGFCFVGAAKKENITLVSTTLASGWPPNKSYKWQDTKALMNFGFKHYKKKELPTQKLGHLRIPIKDGIKDTLSVREMDAPIMLLSKFDNIHISYQLPDAMEAPVSRTTPIGEITYFVNDEKIVSLPIYPTEDIRKKTFFDLFGFIFEKFFI